MSLTDLHATILDLCGLPETKTDSRSLVGLLENPEAEWENIAVTSRARNSHSVCTKEWSYISYENGGEELYDRLEDSQEWTNLADLEQYSEVLTEMRSLRPANPAPTPGS